MKNSIDYSLYLCTDREIMTTPTIEESVELAIKGGCTIVQLREKECTSLDFYQTALNVKKITDHYHVPLIINDRVDIALAVDASGVHVGQSDLPAGILRSIIGPDKILGVSANNLAAAKKAVSDGADYLGVGAMYPTGTKTDATVITKAQLQEIRKEIFLPIVVIGGIKKERLSDFKDTKIDGIAVISGIIGQRDISAAAKELKELFLQL